MNTRTVLSARSVLIAATLCVLPCSTGFAEEAAREEAGHIVSVIGKVLIRHEYDGHSKDTHAAQPGKPIYVGDIITTPSDGKIKLLLSDRSILDIGPSSLFKMDQLKLGEGGQRQVDATVAYGSLRAGVTRKLEGKSHFKVRTSSATMGVRGTEFVVKSEVGNLKQMQQILNAPPGELPKSLAIPGLAADKTEVTVLQGKVEVATPPPPALPGQSATGQPAQSAAPAPAILNPGMQLITGLPENTGRSSPGASNSGAPEVRRLDLQSLQQIASSARAPDKAFDQAVAIKGATKEEEAQVKREERRQALASREDSPARDGKREEGASPAADGGAKAPVTVADASDRSNASSRAANGESKIPESSSGENRERRPSSTASSDSTTPGVALAGAADRSFSGGGTPGKEGNPRPEPAAIPMPPSVIASALASNLQTTAGFVQTIRAQDVTVGAVGFNAIVAPNLNRAPQINTLTIQFKAPGTGTNQ